MASYFVRTKEVPPGSGNSYCYVVKEENGEQKQKYVGPTKDINIKEWEPQSLDEEPPTDYEPGEEMATDIHEVFNQMHGDSLNLDDLPDEHFQYISDYDKSGEFVGVYNEDKTLLVVVPVNDDKFEKVKDQADSTELESFHSHNNTVELPKVNYNDARGTNLFFLDDSDNPGNKGFNAVDFEVLEDAVRVENKGTYKNTVLKGADVEYQNPNQPMILHSTRYDYMFAPMIPDQGANGESFKDSEFRSYLKDQDSSDFTFISNEYSSFDNYLGSDSDDTSDTDTEEQEVVPVNITLEKPVKASEYYDSRFSSGLGDAYKTVAYLDKDLYIGGRMKNGKVAHNRDVKAQQATKDDVTFIYPTDENLSEEELDRVSAILGIKGDLQSYDIFYYTNVEGRDKPYINALKTTPEKALSPKIVTTMLDRNDIEYDQMRDTVLAYIPRNMLENGADIDDANSQEDELTLEDSKEGQLGSLRLVMQTEMRQRFSDLQENTDFSDEELRELLSRLEELDLIYELEDDKWQWIGEDQTKEEHQKELEEEDFDEMELVGQLTQRGLMVGKDVPDEIRPRDIETIESLEVDPMYLSVEMLRQIRENSGEIEGSNTVDFDNGDIQYTDIKITSEVPEFIGMDGDVYGGYDGGENVTLPEDNAEILVNRGLAEERDEEDEYGSDDSSSSNGSSSRSRDTSVEEAKEYIRNLLSSNKQKDERDLKRRIVSTYDISRSEVDQAITELSNEDKYSYDGYGLTNKEYVPKADTSDIDITGSMEDAVLQAASQIKTPSNASNYKEIVNAVVDATPLSQQEVVDMVEDLEDDGVIDESNGVITVRDYSSITDALKSDEVRNQIDLRRYEVTQDEPDEEVFQFLHEKSGMDIWIQTDTDGRYVLYGDILSSFSSDSDMDTGPMPKYASKEQALKDLDRYSSEWAENFKEYTEDDEEDFDVTEKKERAVLDSINSSKPTEYDEVKESVNMSEEQIEQVINRLLSDGTIYEPAPGKVQIL